VLAAPALALVLLLALLFGEGGFEPFPFWSFLATVGVAVAFLLALPREQRLLRTGALLYLATCLACLLVHTPVGSNVERFGVLLAAPLLLCALLASPAPSRGRGAALAAVIALLAAGAWTLRGPVRETAAVAGSEATEASYYAPVRAFFASAAATSPTRVEVPLTRSHWEAALLAPSVPLARGWEKQLDERYDRVLLGSGLDAASYHAWLRAQAVGYVALPDARLDGSSAREGRLIRAGLPYLSLVFASRHWRVYRVVGATPLLSGPGRLTALSGQRIELFAARAGSFVARVHYSPYLTLTRGRGCVGEAPGGWTAIRLDSPGPARVSASFSLARAVSSAPACTGRGA
jgi:hypothetical protein